MHEAGRVQLQFSRSNMGKVPRKKLSIKYIAEACSEPCQTPKMELFAKIVMADIRLIFSQKALF